MELSRLMFSGVNVQACERHCSRWPATTRQHRRTSYALRYARTGELRAMLRLTASGTNWFAMAISHACRAAGCASSGMRMRRVACEPTPTPQHDAPVRRRARTARGARSRDPRSARDVRHVRARAGSADSGGLASGVGCRVTRQIFELLDPRLPERFWSKVSPCPMSGCWLWTAHASPQGYGRIGTGGHTTDCAHRVAYRALVGVIADGLVLDHLCRVRCCVNPAHLEAVKHTENCRRGVAAEVNSARLRSATHCARGHAYTKDNTRVLRGIRRCRTCAHNNYLSTLARGLEVSP